MRRQLLTEFMMKAPYQPATNFWRAVEIEEVINYGLPDGRGLDLGCGDGHLMSIILDHVGDRDIVGLDIDPQETTLARKRNIYRDVVTASGDHLPFSDREFDFAFSNSVLEHIPNIDVVLAEVARVLRPNGRLIFTVPGRNFHSCLKGPRFRRNREAYLHKVDARCFHLRYWDASVWSEHLASSGLNQIHEHEFLTSPQVRRWESIARNTSGLLYSLSGRKKQPIEIQRKLGVRTIQMQLPRFLADLAASALDCEPVDENSGFGCLLVEATKLR